MKYFVSADIHGFYDEWMNALSEKGFDIENPEHKIIICGDLFDRGNKPKEIINFVLKNKEKIILVRGNHEDLMEEMVSRGFPFGMDYHNGTERTINQLVSEEMDRNDYKDIAKKSRLNKVLSLMIDYYETEKYIFVHSWIPINTGNYRYKEDWRNATKKEWREARWVNPLEMYKAKLFPEKTIVFGHWHVSVFWAKENPKKYSEWGANACFDPFIKEGIIALDACTAYSGKVNVVLLEDKI
jgi:hypothetical protein